MTEQSKIPVPKKSSLLERTQGDGIKLPSFKPAPVPKELIENEGAPPRVIEKRVPRRKGQSRFKVEDFEAAPAPTPIAESAPVAAVPSEAPMASPDPVAKKVTPPSAEPKPVIKPVSFPDAVQEIDREHLRDLGMIVPDGSVTGLVEEFRIVKRQVISSARAGGDNDKYRRVLVSSPHPNEGKTFCATNLALAIAAEKECEVLLVDGDVAKPSVLSTLGLEASAGLMDAIADPKVLVEDCVIRTDIPGLFVLPAGNSTNSDSEFLASARTGRVLDRLTRGAPNRIVIFDSPPALAASPAAELAKHVGQTLLVARADRTGQSALEDAIQLLSVCADIKLLLNAAHFSPSGRRFGSYYGYGG